MTVTRRLALIVLTMWLTSVVTTTMQDKSATGSGQRRYSGSGRRASRPRRTDRPNIVFVLTDDQDIELGSMNYMPKTQQALRDAGATFTNSFVTTPMCCPSRSSMLTGMYVHNHFTYTNNDNCSSLQWRQTHEPRSFGAYLHNAGYRTGYFGKYLNEYSGTYIPPGWTEWQGLIRNSRFYNYSINHNGDRIKHDDNYHLDYFTDLIANQSVRFLRRSKRTSPHQPVAIVLSMPAPHGPEDAAPQYQDLFFDVKSHRTPSWNFAPNPDKQWLLQYTGKMSPIQIAFTDLLHTKRLQTLQSVDDAIEKVVQELEDLGQLDNTYVVYTSDHGYHLGQYGLVKGKAMPYEFDIRVPFLIRGPRIPAGVRMPNIVLNVDIAPTLLDIAGLPVPDHMDGNSILKLFDGHNDSYGSSGVRRRNLRVWRDTFLVERGKLTTRKLKVQEKLEAQVNRLVLTKDQRLEDECLKPQYQPPCKPGQQWECRRNEFNKLRVYKCRSSDNTSDSSASAANQRRCRCSPSVMQRDRSMDAHEMRRQLDFLQHHVNRPANLEEPKFIPGRYRRDMSPVDIAVTVTDSSIYTTPVAEGVRGQYDHSLEDDVEIFPTSQFLGVDWTAVEDDDVEVPCRLLSNGTVECKRYVYTGVDEWKVQRDKIDRILHTYRHRIAQLKRMRQHLAESRPTSSRHVIDEEPVAMTTPAALLSSSSVETTFLASTEASTTARDIHTGDEHGDSTNVVDNLEALNEDCICDYDLPTESSELRRSFENHVRRLANKEQRAERRRRKIEQRKHRRNMKRRNRRLEKRPPLASFDHSLSSSYPEFMPGQKRLSGNRRRYPECEVEGLECSRMDNDHWKVPPYWTHGTFCLCPNSNNNTYWCLRTVNDTHNFLYCEFITGFISFYDIAKDPYQLRNAVHDLSFGVIHQLHDTLELMKGCKGARRCNLRFKSPEERASWKQQREEVSRTSNERHQHSQSRFVDGRSHQHTTDRS